MKSKLKTIAIFAIIIFIISACKESNVEGKSTGFVLNYGGDPIDEVIIDGCEYLHSRGSVDSGLTHKGNCSNPIHCYKNN